MAIRNMDIVEIKSMNNPPELVKQIMTACCILIGDFDKKSATKINLKVPGEYWKVVKMSMGNREKFIKRLSDLDPITVPMEYVTAAKQYIGETNPDRAKKVSFAASHCCIWVMDVIAKAETSNGE